MSENIFPITYPATEVLEDEIALAKRSANLVLECLNRKPYALLCFPAGSTVIKTCEELVRLNDLGQIDFTHAHFVALDEWLDLEDTSEDCSSFLFKHLYGPLNIRPEQLHLFDVHATDLSKECQRIDQVIRKHKGIDLMLLGLGMNGHLGLNEPGGSFHDYAKVVDLSPTTMAVGQKYFSERVTLSRGITLGIGHIFEALQVILQVSGGHKKDIVYDLYQAPITTDLPGTIFKKMPQGLVLLDQAAADRIIEVLRREAK